MVRYNRRMETDNDVRGGLLEEGWKDEMEWKRELEEPKRDRVIVKKAKRGKEGLVTNCMLLL